LEGSDECDPAGGRGRADRRPATGTGGGDRNRAEPIAVIRGSIPHRQRTAEWQDFAVSILCICRCTGERTLVGVSETLHSANVAVPAHVARELEELRAENARLLRLLKLTRAEAAPPGPAQSGLFDAPPGPVHSGSPAERKVVLFGALFAARTDIYAVRWENDRTGRAGWLPAVRGGWRKSVPHAEREYLPLTGEVLTAPLSGQVPVGLYPLLGGDRCWWLAADFDGPAAMVDALN
jgi:hypothetical protein